MTDSHNHTKEEREEIEALLELIEDHGWTVVGYNADTDPYTEPSVRIDVEKLSGGIDP